MILGLAVSSCNTDDVDNTPLPTTSTLSIDLNGLENLGDAFQYEGLVFFNGAPISAGTFSVDDNGKLPQNEFTIDAELLSSALNFVLSIEPNPDPSPSAADTKIFGGDFNGNTATLATETIAPSFDEILGKFIIAAPTGTGGEDEKYSGIWFLDNS